MILILEIHVFELLIEMNVYEPCSFFIHHISVSIIIISIYLMLIRESHIFELRSETKFEVCDPSSFLKILMQ